MMSTPRKIALGIIGAGAAVLAGSYFYTPRRPVRPIDAVPPDAFVAIEVDVAALRQSGALQAIFGDRNEQSLAQACGYDPVDKMDDLVFAVPEGATGDFGVAVKADISKDDLLNCANAVVKAHGGDPTADVVDRGSYSVITPRTTSSDATKPARSMGYRAGSPILVGPRSWVYTMIDSLEDAAYGRGSPGEHLTLRKKLAAEITPTPKFLVTATVLLERSVREKLKADMLKEVGTASDSGTSMMLGVLGMTSGVLGLYESGRDVHVVVDLRCEEEPECIQVQRLIEKVRDEWSRMQALRDFGLGPVLDHLEVDHEGTRLQVRAAAAATDVVSWAKLFLESKPIVPAGAASAASPSGGPVVGADDKNANVPTQTLHVTIPEGAKPGDPLTIQVPTPTPGTSGQVQHIVATVPGAGGSAGPTPAGNRAFTVTVPGPPPPPPPPPPRAP
jgi:hypothetical protein